MLTFRLASPDSYRIVSMALKSAPCRKRVSHLDHQEHWHWGIDTMPMMDHGGRPPIGDAAKFAAALAAFKAAFCAGMPACPPTLGRRTASTSRPATGGAIALRNV